LILIGSLMISCSASSNVTRHNTASATENEIVIPSETRNLALDCLDCFIRDSVKTVLLDSVVNDCQSKADRSRNTGRLEGAGAVTLIVLFIKLLTL
jgi:hypothetical protein